jgi:hypothetical protein
MSNSIILPPLPKPEVPFVRGGTYTVAQLRARDLDVAKAVLEGAAELSDAMDYGLGDLSKAIRALEVKHHG